MRKAFVIFVAIFSGCSLADPDKKNCDACLDAGLDTIQSDAKSEAKPVVKSDALPDTKKSDLPIAPCVDNDKDGYCVDVDCDDKDPGVHPNAQEKCNGLDDDCDGTPDNNLSEVDTPCGKNVGECKPGKNTCVNGKLECTGATLPKNEICDGKDNDCDGTIDEDFTNLGKVCEVGVGECKQTGYYECNGSATTLKCSVNPLSPKTEGPPGSPSCYDGLDNDCDGLIDSQDPSCVFCTTATIGKCNDNNPCTFDDCVGGVCKNEALPENTLCSDDLACNGMEKCKAGKCESGIKLSCDDGNQCTQDICDESVPNYCVHAPVAAPTKEGAPGSKECLDGQDNDCDGLKDLNDPDCVGCKNDLECAGANPDPCTNYICNALSVCVIAPKSEGASCDDGKSCTVNDKCTSGICAGTSKLCNDNEICTDDSCNEALQGKCEYAPIQGCKKCTADSGCEDGNPCTQDKCTGGKCFNTAFAEGDTCDDSAFCTINDKCTGGACKGTPRDCSAFANACNYASCNEQFDACEGVPKANGTSCSNGLNCDGNETCQNGFCQSGTPPVCNDNNICTNDVCDPIQDKCVFTLKNLSGSESWTVPGTCSDGIDNDCDGKTDNVDTDCRQCASDAECSSLTTQCKKGVCNMSSFKCEAQNLAGVCNDGLSCTINDACSNGACVGTLRDCSAYGDTCNSGTCNESTGSCQKSPKPDSTVCDDNKWCTVNDHCSSGTCIGGGQRDCGPGYVCDGSLNQCVYQQCQNDGQCGTSTTCVKYVCNTSLWKCETQHPSVSCDDGQWCTIGDYCVNGFCQSGGPRNCNPGTCDEYLDTCTQANAPGCADNTREGFVNGETFPNIAGCSGAWSIAGLNNYSYSCSNAGNTGNTYAYSCSTGTCYGNGCRASDFCAIGWHICNGYSDVSSRLPYGKTCQDAWSGSEKRFFATLQISGGFGFCNTSGTNDIFGCGNYGDPPAPGGSCNPLNVFSSEDCSAIKYPYIGAQETWRCGGPGDSSNELTTVVKLQMIGGGVLCCKN